MKAHITSIQLQFDEHGQQDKDTEYTAKFYFEHGGMLILSFNNSKFTQSPFTSNLNPMDLKFIAEFIEAVIDKGLRYRVATPEEFKELS